MSLGRTGSRQAVDELLFHPHPSYVGETPMSLRVRGTSLTLQPYKHFDKIPVHIKKRPMGALFDKNSDLFFTSDDVCGHILGHFFV